MSFHLAPSLLAADFWRLGDQVSKVTEAGAEILHIDIMDGHFVPNLTMGPDIVKMLKRNTEAKLDVHLMVTNPDTFVAPFVEAGADWISYHVEATHHAHRVCQHIQDLGCKAGVAINPGVPIVQLAGIIDHVDFVLMMSVNPGYGGQAFIPTTFKRLADLQRLINLTENKPFIQVDGGIGVNNIAELVQAGMSVAVAGSSIFKAEDPVQATQQLIALAEAARV